VPFSFARIDTDSRPFIVQLIRQRLVSNLFMHICHLHLPRQMSFLSYFPSQYGAPSATLLSCWLLTPLDNYSPSNCANEQIPQTRSTPGAHIGSGNGVGALSVVTMGVDFQTFLSVLSLSSASTSATASPYLDPIPLYISCQSGQAQP
jgi:hypothetical protein